MTYEFASDNGTSIASIAGWGKTENGTGGQHLLYANMSIVDVEQCKQMNGTVESSRLVRGWGWGGGGGGGSNEIIYSSISRKKFNIFINFSA